MMFLEVLDPRLAELIDSNQEPTLLCSTLHFTEGPVWDEEKQCFFFNSIPESNTYSWSEENGLQLWFENGTKSNGMFLTASGELLICEHATSSVVRRNKDGTSRRVLADYDGEVEFNSPNDIIARSDGMVYFSDPVFGRLPKPSSVVRPIPSDRRGVYCYNPRTRSVRLVADGFVNPNGLAFSPDEAILYVNDSDDYLINAYDVSADGTLKNERLLARVWGGEENHSPDGLKVDEYGNVFCACQNGGLFVFDEEGKPLGIIRLPGIRVVNFCWGGADGLTLFMTCDNCIYTLRMKAKGAQAAQVNIAEGGKL